MGRMMASHRLVLGCVLLSLLSTLTLANMIIPPSFSAAHKTTYLQDNTPIESILKVLSSFEIATHIEVVLVGRDFTAAMATELSTSLKVLSDVSAAASPLKFVHEELVYHVSLGTGLEEKIIERVTRPPSTAPHAASVEAVGEVLGEYHRLGATSTTLFVIHSGKRNTYKYAAKVDFCPQRTFLAKNGFALLDLTATAHTIRSTDNGNDHIISQMEFPFLENAKNVDDSAVFHTSLHDLAALIHRSGEAIVPFPIFSSDMALLGDASASTRRKSLEIDVDPEYEQAPYINEAAPVQDETAIDIVVFTLCMSSDQCNDDSDTTHAVENLLAGLSENVHNVNLVPFHISANEDPQLAHAIHAATSYSSPGSNDPVKVSSKELLYWMGSSKTVRDILRKQGRFYMKKTEMKKRILPVFVLKLPHGVDSVVLNDGKQAAAHAFPEPAGGWLTDEEEKASMFSLHRQSLFESDWPSSAVVAVRTAGGQPLESVRSGLECAGRELPRGYNDYIGELVDVISAAVWGILPSHTHYSSSSRSLVQDYLWARPLSMITLLDKDINGGDNVGDYSFRERRQIPRHGVIHQSDQLIGKFTDILLDASSMRPAINISSLLGLEEHKPNAFAKSDSNTNPFAPNGQKEVKQINVLKKAGKVPEKSIFESFLSHLDLAATAFSHLEYSVAQDRLKDAAKVLEKLKVLVDSMMNMRTGSYTCKDMRHETKINSLIEKNSVDDSTVKDKSKSKDGEHVRGEYERKHVENRRWTWFFGILGSIIIGCVIGYDVATAKTKRGLQ